MMDLREIIKIAEGIAPPDLAAEWDNCGIQIDADENEIKKVLVALEITNAVISEAKRMGAVLIITHHPLIFSPLRMVDHNNVTGNYVIELIKAGISVYSAHTSFDEAGGGNNDRIASLLRLKNVKRPDAGGFLRTGEFAEEISFDDACAAVKDALCLRYMSVVGSPSARIKKVGLCAGAGSGMIEAAAALGCELFITGDIKYHDARYAEETGICLIDAGHYGTEKFFAENFAKKLEKLTHGELEVVSSSFDSDPFSIR